MFYDYKEGETIQFNVNRLYNKIRTVIQKEKKIARGEIGYDRFTKKWSNFISIYDFRGPDPLPFL